VDVVELIDGSNKLVAVFGNWPSFHDAEVLWIKLDRHPVPGHIGPTFDAVIHAFEMTSEVNSQGCYVLRNHVLVHLRFRDVVGLQLDGFNFQNVLCGLDISKLTEPPEEGGEFEVVFGSSYGVQAAFQCDGVEVVAVTPCNEVGEAIPI
jgi:hypothetical protein